MPPKRTVSIYGRFSRTRVSCVAAVRTLVVFLALFFGASSSAPAARPIKPALPASTGQAASLWTSSDIQHRVADWRRLSFTELTASLIVEGPDACDDHPIAEPCDTDESDESDSSDDGIRSSIAVTETESSVPCPHEPFRALASSTHACKSPRAPPALPHLA